MPKSGRVAAGYVVIQVVLRADHRRAGFAACEYIMDYLKSSAPLWKKEIGEDSYFHIERVQTIDVEGLGKLYGAVIEDHASEGYMMYFKTRINDKVISFVASKSKAFNVDEEAEIINMISNIKIIE